MLADPETVTRRDPWFAACHRGRRRGASVAGLLAAMEVGGVDRAVVFTWPFAAPADCAEANDFIAAAQRQHPDRIIGFGVVQPAHPGASAEVLRCARLGLRGIGELNADAQGWRVDDPPLAAVVAASVAAGLPWTLHCSEPVGHAYAGKGRLTPDRLVRLVERFGDLRLVCSHLGGGLPFYAHMPEVRRLCHNLWFDTAAGPLLYEPSAYRAVIDLCGADRVLFGSDFPLLPLDRCREELDAARLTDAERRLVMGETARRLLEG